MISTTSSCDTNCVVSNYRPTQLNRVVDHTNEFPGRSKEWYVLDHHSQNAILTTSEIESSFHKLSLQSSARKNGVPKHQPTEVIDSWEDDDDTDSATTSLEPFPRPNSNVSPEAPPPKSILPTAVSTGETWSEFEHPQFGNVSGRTSDKSISSTRESFSARPEKQTAVAGRLIAGALGVRVPRKTDEQRQYERAVKENEIRRRQKEKDDIKRREEETAKAKAAIWED